ncbi:MAG: hypothetical protein IJ981_01415 [Clostridia bacterium]|nr:hypothetical protein [Clostridia bacterium]MBR6693067.1 hypothetical protein [Clostridia bacterium]
MKKLLSIILSVILIFSLAACGGQEQKPAGITHDRETLIRTGTSKILPHNFVDGKCKYCDYTTIFRQTLLSQSPEILTTPQSADKQGEVVEVWYKTRAYGIEATHPELGELHIVKRAFVYLPAGYDPDREEPYNVMFKSHGNKNNEGYWFKKADYAESNSSYAGGYGTENVLDYMIANDLSEDVIVVGITFYQFYENEKQGDSVNAIPGIDGYYYGYIDPDYPRVEGTIDNTNEKFDTEFWKEFQYDLLPYIVENFNTYAKSSSEEDMIAARDHVAFTGLFRSEDFATSVLSNLLPFFSYIGYETGYIANEGFIEKYNADYKGKYDIKYMFISCGEQEDCLANIEDMNILIDGIGLQQGSDISKGDQVDFIYIQDGAHNYGTWITNLYDELLVFFKK